VRPAGTHEVEWDGRDEAGRRVAAGVYLCRLRAEGTAESRPVIVLQ
jgi:flagellar hook assembly protein FlgD